MKSSDIDQELFTESYCKVCSAQLISESQRVAHYESRKHASKVRLYYMLHPIDGGCPAKKLRSENGSDGDSVDKNKCCTLCNMSFTSAVVAESHYQGKIHAKRLKLLLGEQPTLKATETALSSLKQPHTDGPPPVPSPHQRRDSDRYCQLCAAWFNNPMMAQQHYDGKKHKKNAARADLLEQLGKTLDLGELRGLKRSYTCSICNVTLNSIEQYHAHLKGSKHQTNRRSTKVQNRQRCQCPLQLDHAQHQQLRFYGDWWQPRHWLVRNCGEEDTFPLKQWERITCQLVMGWRKQNFPLFCLKNQ